MEQLSAKPHLENFSIKDVIDSENDSFDERLGKFVTFGLNYLDHRQNLYRRSICSPMANRVKVYDENLEKEVEMVMFGSNNYLGLANNAEVKQAVLDCVARYGVGAGGPPLLNGTTSLHKQAEEKLSKFKKQEDTVIFSSGFIAQLGWMAALLSDKDIVIFDEYSHASFFEGLRMFRCRKVPFRHNDLDDLERKLKTCAKTGQQIWVCIEGVYSMDGDIVDLPKFLELTEKYNCRVALDDAHGTGVLGKEGAGIVEHFGVDPNLIDVHMGTFSKAFGTVGGFIAATRPIAEYIRYMAKPHIFSAALPVSVIQTVLTGIDLMKSESQLIEKLHHNVRYLLNQFAKIGIDTRTDSAIIPIFLPSIAKVRDMSVEFHQRGLFINSVEYPAVPADQQRFRVSVMATHTKEDLDFLVDTIKSVFTKHQLL